MKNTCFKRAAAVLLAVLIISFSFVLPLAAEEPDLRVYDPSGVLTETEANYLTTRLTELSGEHGVELYLATYVADNRFDDFYGDHYCDTVQDLRGRDAVLLVVTYERLNHTYYYNMYTYGEANYAINQKEVNYVLDMDDVYYNIKSGSVAEGAEEFFVWSAKAFEGRVGVSWVLIILVSALISVVIALIVCAGIVAAYKKKRASVEYPLDRYAKLDLTCEKDSFVREYVTRTYSPKSDSSGGGSGRRHGGGGGHRGGR